MRHKRHIVQFQERAVHRKRFRCINVQAHTRNLPRLQGFDESVEGDEVRARFATRLIRDEKPGFSTVYLTGLDHVQHEFGPDTPQAHAALERIDTAVGALVTAARDAIPGLTIVIVSDHGFAPVTHDVNLTGAFAKAGLITLDASGQTITSWDATPWLAAGSAQIVLARPGDAALRARVEALLTALQADPAMGIERWFGADEIAHLGGAADAQYVVAFKIGYEAGKRLTAPPVGPCAVKGTHGYLPANPEMRSTFIIAGPGVAARGSLGEIDMRDIAPTVARVLGVALPTADGRALVALWLTR